ncbi:MAG: hypothetical protein KBC27_03730 [Rickettsiales bacterium]|nr:hypothetical protein [Rickettsiales bacterium]
MEIRKLIILVFFFAFSAYADSDYLAFVNKSFERDLKVSFRLYHSYEKFVKQEVPFYIVIPQRDQRLFFDYFNNAHKSQKIKKLPIFLTEEEVFQKCGTSTEAKMFNMPGWSRQQVVKLCFSKLGMAKNYLTIDSDTYFTRPFDTDILFYKGKARTYSPDRIKKNNPSPKNPIFSEMKQINEVLLSESKDYNNFILGFGMWSSDLLIKLESFVRQKYGYDFADLIVKVPLEMQWYGVFVYYKHHQDFFPLSNLFTLINSKDLKWMKKQCVPTDGEPKHFGVSYQYSTNESYANPCGELKTSMKIMGRSINRSLKLIRTQIRALLS